MGKQESRAAKFVREMKEDTMPAVPGEQQPPVADPENPPEAKTLQQIADAMESDPSAAADMLDQVGAMAERYLNEEDPSWTPTDDSDKACVGDAMGMIKEAASKFRGIKK